MENFMASSTRFKFQFGEIGRVGFIVNSTAGHLFPSSQGSSSSSS